MTYPPASTPIPERMLEFSERIVVILILALLSLTCIVGNLLVILSFAQVKKLRRVHGNLFIISLAVADLIVGTQTLPIIAVNVYSGTYKFGEVWCNVSAYLDDVAIVASVWILGACSIDRLLCIVKPFKYKQLVTERRVFIVTVTLWVYAIFLSSAPLLGWNEFSFSTFSLSCAMNPTMPGHHKYYFLLFQIGSFPVPLVVVGYSYSRIFTRLLAMKNGVNASQTEKKSAISKRKRRFKPNHRAAITVFVACGAFMFCTLPSTLIGNAFWFGKEYEIDRRLLMATAWVLYFNSALNPIIYGVFNPEFRSAYKRIIIRRSSFDMSTRTGTATLMGRVTPAGRRLERHYSIAGPPSRHMENSIRFRESLKSRRVRSQSCVSMSTNENKYRRVSLLPKPSAFNLPCVREIPNSKARFGGNPARSSASGSSLPSSVPNETDSVLTSTVFSNALAMSSEDGSRGTV
ncbi:hypothetical protein ACHWQZ_G002421 [Mnemiopsis leidyi]